MSRPPGGAAFGPPRTRAAAFAVSAAACLAVAACDAKPPGPPPAAPVAPAAAAAPALPVFVDVAKEAGLVAVNHTGRSGEKDWVATAMGGGAIVLDYDQDGRMDIVFVDGTMLTSDGKVEYDDEWRTRVFHNDGGMKFTDVTKKCGVDIKAFGIGGASCDYDADGFPDFYVCCWGRNYLMRNRGDGTFEDVTDKAGVRGDDRDFSTACCWGDVNGDGIQDLYVVNYVDQRRVIDENVANHVPRRNDRWNGYEVYMGPRGLPGQTDRLYLGNGDGTFRDVTATNLQPEWPPRYGFQAVMTDIDNDGDLDIYVPNDGQANLLWINDGHGKFVEQAFESGVAVDDEGKENSSMGVDVADPNRDGWLDIFVTNFAYEHSVLYINGTGRTGRRSFTDRSAAYGIVNPSSRQIAWGTKLLDYDNDGNLDLFMACGHVYGELEGMEQKTGSTYKEKCLLLRGDGVPGHPFEDVSATSGPALQESRVWRGAAFADFDDDGDLDVFVTALNDPCALFRNDGGNRNNFLVLRLVGKGGMRDPSGARVTVYLADGKPHLEELHHGISFCGDNDPRFFFGLGAETAAARVEVRWPGGETQTFEHVAGRTAYVLEQGKTKLRKDVR
jgi:hypothetical protein